MVLPMIKPMKVGLLGLQQGVLGGQEIISVGYQEDNKALKARGWLSIGLDHSDLRDGRNGFIRRGNAQCGLEVQGSASADWEQKAFCWFVAAERYTASHDGDISSSFRQFLAIYSIDIRCSFVRFLLVPRSVLVRSSID